MIQKNLIALVIVLTAFTAYGQDEARLMRFPSTNGEQIVFTYAGDLYSVPVIGGLARKLTSHDGFEMFARFSPDGKQIAFTGQYDGNTEVYLMPAGGGVPKRLTHTATLGRDDISDRMGPNNIVMCWHPDGRNIYFRSRKQTFNDFVGQLFHVPVEGGLSKEVPLSTGGFCSWSPDGKQLAFNRVFREFRTWKYYKGGMADDIRIFDPASGAVTAITDNQNQDVMPMWWGDEIYYISDRDRTMNIFAYNTKTRLTRKVTQYTDYDVKFPSLGKDAIVYENGGYIYYLDLRTQQSRKVEIRIADDMLFGRNELKDASKSVGSYEIAPDGKRALFSARGDIWTVPAENGITRNLTASSGAHDRNPLWSPDGQYIAFISDMSGEYEIYIQKQDGSEPPAQLTQGADTYKYRLKWSPDSKKILWNDKKLRLQYVDINTKAVTLVDQNTTWEYGYFNWAPDSRWITYALPQPNGMSLIMLYNTESREKVQVTDHWYDAGDPTFSEDGKYLFFVSDRDFSPIYSSTEWNHAYADMSRIYMVTLAKSTPNPFAPENDEVSIKKSESGSESGEKANEAKGKAKGKDETQAAPKVKPVVVDADGLRDRILVLPGLSVSNYRNLTSVGNRLFYVEMSRKDFKSTLKSFDLTKKKETEHGNYGGYEISADGKKILVSSQGKYSILDLPSGPLKPEGSLDLNGMKVWVDKKVEWAQIYDESWRQMRDFFYVPNMHGLDWPAMKDKYRVLLPYVNNRHDLNYLIGELIGELNVGHAYVNGGETPEPSRIQTGLLGAKLSKHSSGYFRIDKILKGQNWDKGLRSPLTEVGVDAREGDFIVAVNGKSTKDVADIYALLIATPNRQVQLTLNASPAETGGRNVLVVPTANEGELYYYNWVQENIRKVNEATNGEVGYIHIPDMVTTGLNEFAKYFYPQLTKKALVIDGRGNGGGNVSPMIIERLMREVTRANMSRNVSDIGQTPRQMMLGPKVLIINQYSASDGDLFPYAFKKHGLGKVIGMRSWGGVVGIRGSLPFVDGADLRKPEFASYSSETSDWIIEGIGVEPDIEVDNDPHQEYLGTDTQLNKAIEVILEELKNYKPLPPIPAGPDKSR
jgi:tricorn protease